ncbi:MAG TPA: hypothetical protein VI756_05300 [Blastocatellia bacterium]
MSSLKLESIKAESFICLSVNEQTDFVAGLGPTPTVGLTKEPTFSGAVIDQAPDYVMDA